MNLQVQGHGQSSKLMVIGDTPDEREIKIGKAWENPSGWLLNSIFTEFNVKFGELYKTLYYKSKAPDEFLKEKDKKKKWKIELPNTELMEKVLIEELRTIKPMSILSCGELALRFLTGEKGVDKFRGSLLPLTNNLKHATGLTASVVVPIYHPRDLTRMYSARSYTKFDIARAITYTTKRYAHLDSRYSIWVCRSPADLKAYLNRGFHNCEFYTTDIETYLGFITCVGLCYNGREAISVPLMDFKISVEDRAELTKVLDKVLCSDRPKINQNIKYDHYVSERWGYIYNNVADDTMLRAHSMYPELPKGLDFLTSLHTEIPYYKDEGKEFDPSLHDKDQLYLYNAKDCLADWLVYKSQLEDQKQVQVWSGYTVDDFHTQKVFPLYDIYRRIDKAGIRVDSAQKELLKFKYSAMLEDVTDSISKAVGFDYNLNSPKQAAEIVYKMLGMPPMYKINPTTHQKSLTTDEEALEEIILNKVDHCEKLNSDQKQEAKDLLQLLLTARHLDGGLEWLNISEHPDGRMYTSTKQTGTETGRTSAARTVDYAWGVKKIQGKLQISQIQLGMSFQTVPKHGKRLPDGTTILNDLITIFVPDDDCVFVEGDKSQAEARVVCVLSNDYDQLKYFDKPNDIHLLTTSWCTGVPYEELLKKRALLKDVFKKKLTIPEECYILFAGKPTLVEDARQDIGKPGRHAGNYDMEPPRLSMMAHLPVIDCQLILIQFHRSAPKIREVFHAEVRKAMETVGQLVNPYGRIRDFFDRMSNKYYKEGYAQIPQSTVSDHVKFDILTPLDHKWYKEGVRCLNEKHDSLLFSVPKVLRDDFSADFIKYGSTPIDFRNGTFVRPDPLVIPTDINWTDTNWKDMKEWKM